MDIDCSRLARNRLTAIPVKEKNEYGDYVATGCNINFAWTGNTLLFPQFGLNEDKEALTLIRQLMPENKIAIALNIIIVITFRFLCLKMTLK